MKSRFKVGDIIVISAVFLAAAILFVCIFLPRSKDAKTLIIKNNGKETFYSLNEDKEFEVSGNGYILTVEIKNGSAFVKEASCPDNTCVHTGKIDSSGRIIACVPAGVTLGISEKKASYDFVAG